MEKILWVVPGAPTRVTGAVLPEIQKHFSVTVLGQRASVADVACAIANDNFNHLVVVGDLAGTREILEFLHRNSQAPRVVAWLRINCIPSANALQDALRADKLLVTNPVIADVAASLCPESATRIFWAGLGSDAVGPSGLPGPRGPGGPAGPVNDMIASGLVQGVPVSSSDIIILYANSSAPRKRLEVAVRAFARALNRVSVSMRARLRLWIHTDSLVGVGDLVGGKHRARFLLSERALSDDQVSAMYTASAICLQTSAGECWPLANLEAAAHGSLQVVPDFLACRHHFRHGRGLLVPAKVTKAHDGDSESLVGLVSAQGACEKLLEAIDLVCNRPEDCAEITARAREHARSLTWSAAAQALMRALGPSGGPSGTGDRA